MKTELRVIGLLLAVTAVAVAEMRTWTFQKSGKTMQGEVVAFAGDTVTMNLPDGKAFSVPIAYLIESNRTDLAAERAKQWKQVEIVTLEGSMSAGRYKKCIVQGSGVGREILIQLLPASVETVLNSRNEQAAKIAALSDRIGTGERAAQQAHALIPVGTRDPAYDDQRAQVSQADIDLATAKSDLQDLRVAYTDAVNKTRAATIVKIKNIGLVYQGLPVWECADPRKPQK
jgi:hypothetical protein